MLKSFTSRPVAHRLLLASVVMLSIGHGQLRAIQESPVTSNSAPSEESDSSSAPSQKEQNDGDKPTLAELMQQLREQQAFAGSQTITEQIISTFSSHKCQQAFGMSIPGNVHILTADFGPTTNANQNCRIQSYVVDGRVIDDLSSIDAAKNLSVVRPGYSLPMSNSPALPFIMPDNAMSRNIAEQYELAPERFRLEWENKTARVYFDFQNKPTRFSGILAFEQDSGQHWVPVRLDLHVTDNRPNHSGADILWKLRNLEGNNWYSSSFRPAGMVRTEWAIGDEEKSWMESTFLVVDRTEPANKVSNDPPESMPPVTDGDRLSFPSNPDELKADIFRLQTEIAVLRQQLGPDHPKMKQAEIRLQVFEELYDEHQKHAAAQAQAQESDQLLSVLTLQHISATNAERVIRELYPTEQYSLAADERTNTLIIRANGEFRELVAALIGKLDETAAATDRSEPATSTVSKPEPKPATAESVAQLKQQASDLDQNVQKFASDVKSHLQSGKSTAEEIETLKRQLRDAVTQNFDVRQQLKRAELQLMEARLKQLKLSIELREQLATKMIDRRVEELLPDDASTLLQPPTSFNVECYSFDAGFEAELKSLFSTCHGSAKLLDLFMEALVREGKCLKVAGGTFVCSTSDEQRLALADSGYLGSQPLILSMRCGEVLGNRCVTVHVDDNSSHQKFTFRLPLFGTFANGFSSVASGGRKWCFVVVSR